MHWYISYRQKDSAGYYGRLATQLKGLIPGLSVLSTPPQPLTAGQRREIEKQIGQAEVVLAVIGRGWAGVNGSLLAAHDDPIGFELATALAQGTRIVPLLVQDAGFPARELPPALAQLATVNARKLGHGSFQADVKQLVESIMRPDRDGPWLPTAQQAKLRVIGATGGFVKRYLETEHSPARIIVDGAPLGVLRLVGETFETDVLPGKHTLVVEATAIPRARSTIDFTLAAGDTVEVSATRNWLTGSITLSVTK